MHRYLRHLQLVRRSTAKPFFCIKKPACQIGLCHADCCTSAAALEFKKYKSKKALYGTQTPFKHHYNVGYSELVGLMANKLADLRYTEKTQINELLLLFKDKGYKWPEIKRDKEILLLKPSEIRDRLQLLDEFSIFHPRLHDVMHIRIFLQSKILLLRQFGIYSKSFDILDHLLFKTEKLDLSEEVVEKIRTHFEDINMFSLADIYMFILVHYFSKRFNVDFNDAKVILEGHHLPTWKPLTAYIRICDTIIDTLEMGITNILNHPKLLNINPDNVLKIISKHLDIGGMATIELTHTNPELLLIPERRLTKWILLLKSYKVKQFDITRDAIKVFKSDNFKEAEERLKVIKRIPEYELIQVSKKFFELLIDPHAVKKLMEAVHSGTVLNSLRPVLVSPHQNPRMLSQEMKIYTARKLGLDENKGEHLLLLNEVRTTLGLANLHLVLNLLLDFGFTKEQIINCIQIIGFEHSILKSALEEFPTLPEAQPFDEWIKNPYVLHLLAYIVKRNTSPHW